jgi:hypothetical protein
MSENKHINELKSDLDTMIGNSSQLKAEKLYAKGWRKQSEGEWKKPSRYSEPICTICKKSPCQYFGMLPPYCPNCGAKMKGGE